MRDGGNVVALGEGVVRELERLEARYPIGIEFDVVRFQPEVIDGLVRSFAGSLFQAVGIVVGVLLVVLGLRTGVVVASLVPAAIIMSLFVMALFRIGLDQISLAALIIALGMVVDNAIVMAESIIVLLDAGRRPVDAAVEAARELRVPLLSASLTTAAAFLPIFLAESTTGQYTAPLFKVVTIALLSSWVLTLTLTPLLCARFLRRGTRPEPLGEGFGSTEGRRLSPHVPDIRGGNSTKAGSTRAYRVLLLAGLRRPVVALTLVVALFGGAILAARSVPTVFFPPSDLAIFTAEYELPAGASIARTTAVVEEIDRFLMRELRADAAVGPAAGGSGIALAVDLVGNSFPASQRTEGVTNWVTFVGNGGPRFHVSYVPEPESPDYAFSILNATSRRVITDELIPRIEAFCRDRFPDLDVTLKPLQIATPIGAPVEVRVSGFQRRSAVRHRRPGQGEAARDLGAPRNVTDDWGAAQQEAGRRGGPVASSPRRRQQSGRGDSRSRPRSAASKPPSTAVRESDSVVPRHAPVDDGQPRRQVDMTQLENLNVHAQATGRTVPLLQVADTDVVWEPSTVRRRNRTRTVTVAADVEPGVTPTDVVTALRPWLDEQEAQWPLGFRYEFGGEEEGSNRGESVDSVEKLPVGAVIILLLLVAQFNSLRRTAIILLTIPLGFIGVVAGLIVSQSHSRIHGVARQRGAGRDRHQQRHRAHRQDRHRDAKRPRTATGGRRGGPATAAADPAHPRRRPSPWDCSRSGSPAGPCGSRWRWRSSSDSSSRPCCPLGVVPILFSLLFGVRFDQFRY